MRTDIILRVVAWLEAGWRRRYWIATPILLLPMFGVMAGLLLPKKYTSYTTILVQDTAKLNPFLKDISVSTNLKERFDGIDALLHSRHILLGVARDLGMIEDKSSEADRNEAVAMLSRGIHLKLSGSDLVQLIYTSSDPRPMEATLRFAATRLLERIIAPERSSVEGSENFLNRQLEERRRDLDHAERALADYRGRHASQLPELHATNVQRLSQMRQMLAERSSELAGSAAAFQSMRAQLSQTNPVVGRVEESLVSTLGELALLRARFTDEHSQIQAVLRKLRRLEEERSAWLAVAEPPKEADLDRLWNLATTFGESDKSSSRPLLVSQLTQLQAASARQKALSEEVANLKIELAQVEAAVTSFGSHEQKLTELTRDLTVKRELYGDLLKRAQMAQVTGALGRFEESERVKIIDPPFTPHRPSSPPLIFFFLSGLAAGLALGLGLAVLAEAADTTVHSAHDVERLSGAPVLARLPNLEPLDISTQVQAVSRGMS